MTRSRLGSLPLSLLALLGVALVGTTASASSASSSSPQPPSANDKTELICHTSNPAECYPKVFVPTDEFQIVHPDQDLPKGLHVRLNIQTGQKEAKINVPEEVNPSLEGLPVDSSVVIVDPDPDSSNNTPPQQHQPKPKIPANAPVYDPVGKIKQPPSAAKGGGSSEDGGFYANLAHLKKGLDIDAALTTLEEISHDIYYGLKLTEDLPTIHQLFCLAHSPSLFTPSAPPTVRSRARLAALTLASAVQNNPKALDEIEKHWTSSLRTATCPGSAETLGSATFRLVSASATSDEDAGVAKARIAALSGLLRNSVIRRDFLSRGGMDMVLAVLAFPGTGEWEAAQKKAAFLMLDNFLDENMGAALGEWPTSEHNLVGDKECAGRLEGDVRGDCWDWHVKQLAGRLAGKDKSHWSRELLAKLGEQRKVNGQKKKKNGKEEL